MSHHQTLSNIITRYFLSAVEAWVPESQSTFAIVGDSITDGHASDTDENDRYVSSSPMNLL